MPFEANPFQHKPTFYNLMTGQRNFMTIGVEYHAAGRKVNEKSTFNSQFTPPDATHLDDRVSSRQRRTV